MNQAAALSNRWFLPLLLLVGGLLWMLQPSPAPTINVHEVEIPEAQILMRNGALVIDVRGEDAYAKARVGRVLDPPVAIFQGRPPSPAFRHRRHRDPAGSFPYRPDLAAG